MSDLFRQASTALSNLGMSALNTAANVAQGVLGPELSSQLFDNYVPLERYTEYQRTYNWEVMFPFTIGGVPGAIVSKYCKAIAFGDYQFKEITEQQRGPKSLFTPGTLSIDAVTAVFLVPTPNLLNGYFSAWRNLIVDKDGFYAEQNKYKRPIYVRLYTTQGITAGTIKLVGAFPQNNYKYELSYSTEAVVKHVINFSIDDIEFTGIDIGSSIPRVLRSLF